VDDARTAGRRAWWQAAPPPATPPVSARRAYGEVMVLFVAFFGSGVASALLLLAGRLDADPTRGYSWAQLGPASFDDIAVAAMAVALVVLLGRLRGLSVGDLGLRRRRDDRGRVIFWGELRVAAWAIVALLAGGIITGVLKTGSITTTNPSAATLLFDAAHSVQAGFVEECVVLAFLVATLRQARRPTAEIVAVAVLCRVSYHLYYGPGVLGIAVWAAVFAWLYLRTRSLVPLIAVHCCWDLVVTFAQRWPSVAGFAALAMVAVVIAAPISWLVERAGRRRVPPGPWLPPPGWHPDPWRLAAWRWWDGGRWTELTAPSRTPSGVDRAGASI